LADDQAQIVRLLEALNQGGPAEILRRSLEHDALDWVQRGLSCSADLGLSPEIAAPLKAYAVDGEILRAGSANFSAGGEPQQDNDLIVIRDACATAKFDVPFERMWDARSR
jgi:hypothetical protein